MAKKQSKKKNSNGKSIIRTIRNIRKAQKAVIFVVNNTLRALSLCISIPFWIIFIIALFIISFFMMRDNDDFVNDAVKALPYIIINEEELEWLWIEFHKDGENKWKIVGCENNELPENIYSSKIDWYVDSNWSASKNINANICFYNLLYVKKIKWELNPRKLREDAQKIKDAVSVEGKYTIEQKSKLLDVEHEFRTRAEKMEKALIKLELINVWESRMKDYRKDQIGFKKYIDFPTQYFENNAKELQRAMLYDYFWREYWEAFPEWMVLNGWFLDIREDVTIYNMLEELWTQYTERNILYDFIVWNHWLPDFPEELNDRWEYYDYNCPKCRSEECTCTWDVEEDKWRTFESDDLGKVYFDKYVAFIRDLEKRKVTAISKVVKSPFRNFLKKWKECIVDVKLTQRDGPNYLIFTGFKWYPSVDWVPTHAGLDIVGSSTLSCWYKNVPVFSVTDWVVVYKSFSLTSWWHSIIVKTEIQWEELYFRYSHFQRAPKFKVWDVISTETILWFQWTTGPSTWEHLDLTITKGWISYWDYLRDTLNWGWLFEFSFVDMLKDDFSSDYNVWTFTNACKDCKLEK